MVRSVGQWPAICVWQLYSLLLTAAAKQLSSQSEVTSNSWIGALKCCIEAISGYDIAPFWTKYDLFLLTWLVIVQCVHQNKLSRYCHDVRPSVYPPGTAVHCDHMVHVTADLSLRLDSPIFWAPLHQSMSTYSQPSFSSSTSKRGGVWMCKLGVISQEWLKIEVILLLSANRKSYMPCQLAQQWITLSDLEWQFHDLSVHIMCYLCGSWTTCCCRCFHVFVWLLASETARSKLQKWDD